MRIRRYMMAIMVSGLLAGTTKAQLAPLGAMYFQNQYLNNPAFAGLESGLTLDLGYRQQWSTLPGSPKIQVLTATYAMTPKAGIGLNLYNDKMGLFNRTRLMGTYAYHLPLDANNQKLSFGVSFGFMDELVDYSKYDGDMGDVSVNNFNQRQQYLDGDFGVAYTADRLRIQASLPNLRNNLGFAKESQQVVNEARFFAAASYKLQLNPGTGIEPKVAYRSITGFTDIFDLGANFTFADEKIGLMAIYHTTKSATFGFSAKVSNTFNLMGYYTSNTSALMGQTNGNFEVNLKANLFKKK